MEFGPNAAVLVFVERRNSENPEKSLAEQGGDQQQTLPTYTYFKKRRGERRMAVVERKLHDRKELWFPYLQKKTMSSSQTRWQQKPHRFAYLTMENSIFARFARAIFIF